MVERTIKRSKTLWKKEKLLVKSNFSFSHSVFKRLVQETHNSFQTILSSHNVFLSDLSLVRQNVTLCGNGLMISTGCEIILRVTEGQ